jgi:hypothetical protein
MARLPRLGGGAWWMVLLHGTMVGINASALAILSSKNNTLVGKMVARTRIELVFPG